MERDDELNITPAALVAYLSGDFANALVASTPGGIQAQEKAGQSSLVNGQFLPKDCPRAGLEKLGFIFGEDMDGIFVHVQMPQGWHKKATDHDMHSKLMDNKGRERGNIFYKAAFYDRRARLDLYPRYSVIKQYGVYPESKNFESDTEYFAVLDAVSGEQLFHTGQFAGNDWETGKTLLEEAIKWATEKYPDYQNVLAYWD